MKNPPFSHKKYAITITTRCHMEAKGRLFLLDVFCHLFKTTMGVCKTHVSFMIKILFFTTKIITMNLQIFFNGKI